MITSRLLPVEEWARLDGTYLEAAWRYLNPADTQIVVVEDDEAIVACWAVVRWVHVEGLWIAPAYRKRVSVVRRLWGAMVEAVKRWETRTVVTSALTEDVRRLLAHVHATEMPGIQYVFTVPEE